ncbi:Cell morphogenesis protein PAG1 [Tilletia horrida]|uniref:Cell morphogenesis protein PAG1 n=1 Tax=Tilletia horrida TaxID=155126 RepID=A0AAN6G6W4_9BASI|nr:Cell morphogenesis protein PAG1 [Tilletia horrida]
MSISQVSVGDLGAGFGYTPPGAAGFGVSGLGPGSSASGTPGGIGAISSSAGSAAGGAGGPAGSALGLNSGTGAASGFAFPRPSFEGSVAGSSSSRPPREPFPGPATAAASTGSAAFAFPRPSFEGSVAGSSTSRPPREPFPFSKQPGQPQQPAPRPAQGASQHTPQYSSAGFADPQTPSEYALNVLMSRFINLANERLANTMNKSVDAEPLIAAYLSSRVDGVFEKLITSLGQIARKHAKAVIDSLIRWRSSVLDSDEIAMLGRRRDEMAGFSFPTTGGTHRSSRPAPNHLRRRKAHVCTYLLTNTLEGIARILANSASGSRIPLTERDANTFETFAFETLQSCCREIGAYALPDSNTTQLALATSAYSDPLLKLCFESASALLGELSRMRFTSVADRFVSAIEAFQKAGAPKDGELQLENMMLGARHLHITVFPMEAFEEGAEFVDTLSKFFVSAAVNASVRLRLALADTFVHLMLPVAGLASAEINHPAWTKAIDTIWPRALQMAAKPKYWNYAYPLHATLMAVSPGDRFLAHWTSCIDAGTSKLKDRATRIPVLHVAAKLLWVYLFRCHESSAATLRRLESFFRVWFPSNRKVVFCADVSTEIHTRMVHFVLFRQFEYGRDLVLDFLRDAVLNDGRPLALNPDLLSPVRMSIAIGAIVRTLNCHVQQESAAFPSGSNFFAIEENEQPANKTSNSDASLGDDLPADFTFPKKDIEDAQTKFNTLISKIALICDATVGELTVFDDRVSVLKGATATTANVPGERSQLERDGYVVQAHSPLKLILAYAGEHQPTLDLLRACIDSWPRCLSPAIGLQTVLSILQRALLSADPNLARSASATLTRIGKQRPGAPFQIVSNFMRWIFRPQVILWEVHSNQQLLMPKLEVVLKAWVGSLERWLEEMTLAFAQGVNGEQSAAAKGLEMERLSAWAVIDEIEANAIILLCSAWRPLRVLGVRIFQLVASLDDAISRGSRPAKSSDPTTLNGKAPTLDEATRIIALLQRPCSEFCDPDSPLLDDAQKERFIRMKAAVPPESLASLVQSEDPINASIWVQMLPGVLRECLNRFPTTIAMFRTNLTGRILAMDPYVVFAVGWGGRAPSTPIGTKAPALPLSGTDQSLLASSWRSYVLALCTTTSASEASRGTDFAADTSMGRISSTAERVISARDLFFKLEPFLASEYGTFREGAVVGLGNINTDLYPTLLEAMHSISARINDEFRGRGPSKSGSKRNRRNERLRTGVGQILHLTSSNLVREGFLSDQKVVQTILAWVHSTFLFLTDREIRDDWSFQRLRRFFAGVVEAFFDGLSKIGDTERYFSFDSRFRMFQLFREWHSYSETSDDGPAKLANILASTAEQYREEWQRKQVVTSLLSETQALSYQAACTMAALCQGAVSLVGSAVPAPMSGTALEAPSLLSWLSRLFNSSSRPHHAVARRALRGLLLHNASHHEMVSLVIDCAVSERDTMTIDRSFFAVVTETMLLRSSFSIPVAQAACLAFLKLGHTDRTIRELALRLLHMLMPAVTDDEFAEKAMGSLSQMTALHQKAQINLVVLTCQRVPALEPAFASELAFRLPSMPEGKRQACLQLLPHVLRNVDLFKGVDGTSLTPFVTGFLTNLSFITMRFGDTFQTEVDELWTALVTGEAMLTNADAITKFFVEQSLRARTADFIILAKKVLACLFTHEIGHYLFDEICKLIEPNAMIPIPRERVGTPSDLLDFYVADLHGELLGPGRSLVFSVGQIALLFVGELNQGRSAQLKRHLPVLLHAAITQIDSQFEFVRSQAISILDQLVRSLAPPQRFFTVLASRKDEAQRWWTFDAEIDDVDDRVPDAMRLRVDEILTPLCDFVPDLRELWGSIAHFWATQGPVRHLAIRSLQMFRVLMPTVNPRMLVDMLARLSNTVSDPDPDIQIFTLELLYTLRSIVKATSAREVDLLAHVYWATVACLSTSVESEFLASIRLLDSLMDKLDLAQQETQEMLLSKRPEDWEGDPVSLQKLVMRGLRSSVTHPVTLRVLGRITRLHNNKIIDTNPGRLAFVFAAAMPWFMHKMEEPTRDHSIAEQLAMDVGELADFLGKKDISRICASVTKNRFRTKEDLTRQGVMCLRAHYLPLLGPDLAILMIGLCLNNTIWLRKQVLRLIKVFLQNINTQDASFSKLGLELLMPVLQLLSTPLAAEALDVLEEPLAINGGLASQQVLRMSLQWSKMNHSNDHALDTAIFGAPQESGWAVARPQDASLRTRINIQAVFKQTELTLDMPLLSSNVNFVTDDYYDGDQEGSFVQEDGSLNDRTDSASVNELVNQLHDLSAFFIDETAGAVVSPATTATTTVASQSTSWKPATRTMSSAFGGGSGTAGSRTASDVASHWASFSDRGGIPSSASQTSQQQQQQQQPQSQQLSSSSPSTAASSDHAQQQQQQQRTPRPTPGLRGGSIEKVARILARSPHSKQQSQHSEVAAAAASQGNSGKTASSASASAAAAASPATTSVVWDEGSPAASLPAPRREDAADLEYLAK